MIAFRFIQIFFTLLQTVAIVHGQLYDEELSWAEKISDKVLTFVNEKVVPDTDPECTWHWGHWRCDPQCECKLKYKFGDYSPGRACRSLTFGELDPNCDPSAGDDISLLEKFGRVVVVTWRRVALFSKTYLLPRTDDQCQFAWKESWKSRRPTCSPHASCSFQPKFGDLTVGRACRYKYKEESKSTWS
uniref:Uncharacterized protein n=1 Tax=Fibrocapsa japonica TaxID=94617 RepID=A0A7S2UXV6_9STRA|mmetsp:Transcript_19547/g.28191  ORF Transcript_19547/g.28191 Transcript_19547/m.28191 type:complete len:188 (+) Transcript_19547:153-716(+)